jgi:hypothetical protein
VAPVAFILVELPGHIVGETAVAFTVGSGATVIGTVAVLVHPFPSVPVTVYVIEEPGVAFTVPPVVALNPVEDAHVYVLPPVAFIFVEFPAQILAVSAVAFIVGDGLTVTATVAVAVQPAAPPVTVYVCELAGVATTDAPVVTFNPVEGDHVYVVAPNAFIFVESPAQKVGVTADAVTVVVELTVITTVAVCVQLQAQPPTSVPVTVYVVVAVGVAITVAPVVTFKLAPGLQV